MEAANSDSHVQQRRKNRHGHSQFPKRGVRHSFAAAPKVSHVPLSLPFKYTEHSTTTFVGCPWQKKSGRGGKSPPPRTTKQRHAFGPGCESRRRKRLRGACDNEIGRQTVKKNKENRGSGRRRFTHIRAHVRTTQQQCERGRVLSRARLRLCSFFFSKSEFGQKGLRAQHNSFPDLTFR